MAQMRASRTLRDSRRAKNGTWHEFCETTKTNKNHMVQINSDDYKRISKEIADHVSKCEREFVVELYGIELVFRVDCDYETRRVSSGVEFMGDIETWDETVMTNVVVHFDGAWDKDGDAVETNFDENKIFI